MTPEEQDRAKEQAHITAQEQYDFAQKNMNRIGSVFNLWSAIMKWGALSVLLLIGACMLIVVR